MRVIVFFDLPMFTLKDKREYTKFRKFLIKNGFMMMQESVYCKIALNQNSAAVIAESLKKNKPENGLVQMLTVTEKQYSRMEFIVGCSRGDIINSDDRFVEL